MDIEGSEGHPQERTLDLVLSLCVDCARMNGEDNCEGLDHVLNEGFGVEDDGELGAVIVLIISIEIRVVDLFQGGELGPVGAYWWRFEDRLIMRGAGVEGMRDVLRISGRSRLMNKKWPTILTPKARSMPSSSRP